MLYPFLMFLSELDFSNLSGLIIILFVLGIALLIVEAVMPGIGVAGVLGILSLIAGVVLASQVVSPGVLILIIMAVLIIIVGMLYWIYRSAVKGGRVSKLLMLNTKAGAEEGYHTSAQLTDLVGLEGEAITTLRPTGTGNFQGKKLDVVADGEFISKGSLIRITEVEGFRIVVKKLEKQ